MGRHVPLDPRTVELLRIVAEALADVPHAIGGGIALAGHGVRRFTSDVDVFAPESSRRAIFRALRDRGLTVSPIMEPFHYIAYPDPVEDPEIRIDLLFPAGEPDLSGAENPIELEVGGVRFRGFQAELLAATKLYSERLQDHADIEAMIRRGIIEPDAVRLLIASFDPVGVDEWDELIHKMKHRRRGRAGRVGG